jgi:hypothetical protein
VALEADIATGKTFGYRANNPPNPRPLVGFPPTVANSGLKSRALHNLRS